MAIAEETPARRPACPPALLCLLPLLALAVALLIVYAPALHGRPLWDDDAHLTRPHLRGVDGLRSIWFTLGATQQYYPVVHSLFWVEHRLFGDATFGYHLVNVLLHALAAWLLFLLLRRLEVPGALLAAGMFALHPVNVESVAWIAEQKNTLAAVFSLAAAQVYLGFDESRRRSAWALSFLLFLLALLSKSVTATLPAVLLVLLWWRRGRITGGRDLLPLAPWLAIGAASGLFTAWVERTMIGAEGAQFALTPLERWAVAGRAVWFYLGKLLWPAHLLFVYPRWDLTALRWWDYLLFPAALAVMALAWRLRARGRGPLAALLIFVGTLLPVLGFFNVYPFLFSFVADHFQYHAGMAVFALAAAGLALAIRRAPGAWRPAATGGCALLLVALGALSREQSRIYQDPETLYRSTLAGNPGCWLARNNLSVLLRSAGRVEEALREVREAIALNPEFADAHNNLGTLLAGRGDLEGARAEFVEALRLERRFAEAHANLGRILLLEGIPGAAGGELEAALRLDPDSPQAHHTLAQLLESKGEYRGAIEHERRAAELQPGWPAPLEGLQRIADGAPDPAARASARELWRRLAP